MAERREDWIPLHKQFFLDIADPIGSDYLRKGQIVTLMYKGEQRWVLVVDPNWEQKVHVLDMKYLPRRAVLRLLNEAPPSLTPRQFYELFVNKAWVKEFRAYRTYDRAQISDVREITYNLTLVGPEKDEPDIEEPNQGAQKVSVDNTGKVTLQE